MKTSAEEDRCSRLVGHLGTTDPSNLLQNIATNRETGVLSVEYKNLQFRAQFEVGKLTHAKVGKVMGNSAVTEFASSWKEGIFVFIQRTPPPDLANESCKVTKLLDKMLLDAALAKDNTDVVLKKLPRGIDSILEKMEDEKELLNTTLPDPLDAERSLTQDDMVTVRRVWESLDGSTTLATVIHYIGNVTTWQAARAVATLQEHKLAMVPAVLLHTPLEKFQLLTSAVTEKIGLELSIAFLRLSLRDSIGYSGRVRVYSIGTGGEVGVDMAAAAPRKRPCR